MASILDNIKERIYDLAELKEESAFPDALHGVRKRLRWIEQRPHLPESFA